MLVAVDAMDFHFESTCTTPYMSAPSSPRRFGHGGGDYYFSAPTSPARASAIYQEFNSTQRFNWDESIENPKSRDTHDEEDDEDEDEDVDFAFDFGVQLDRTSLTADELFDGGKIKPLLQQPQTTNRFSQIDYDEFNNKSRNRKSPISSPRSPTTHQGKKQIHPFNRGEEQDRGRGRTMTPSSSKSNRSRESRSLSPLRIAEFVWEEEQQQLHQQQQNSSKPTTSSSTSSAADAADAAVGASLKGSKKWSFKDLLLFRSASEGRASDKDPLRKYTAAVASKRSSTNEIDEKNNGSSFRSTDGSRKKGPVSAHELHYKVNRAVAEESKRKTYLPYKPRLFGFLGFNPTTVHSQRF